MTSQLSLDMTGALLSDAPVASSADPWTSHTAARKVTRDGTRAVQQNVVLGALKQWPSTTSAELAQHIGSDRFMTARRLPELRAAGFVRNGEARTCAVTGCKSLTWEIA